MDEEGNSELSTRVVQMLRSGLVGDSLQERQALRELEAQLFGGPSRTLTLSRYVMLDRIGAGGAGVVYRAYDKELDRRVAVKMVRAADGTDAWDQRLRLIREAKALAKLSHPNVVAIHDVGSYDESDLGIAAGSDETLDIPLRGVFVVMELVEGENLGGWLRAAARSRDAILDAMLDAGRGLAAAHAKGLVHRDFKPENVLMGAEGRPRVSDFGLAQAAGAASPKAAASGSDRDESVGPLTATGTVLGTPRYMSPEQHAGEPADARSDQFSFCLTLWEAVCGTSPFSGATLDEIAAAKHAGLSAQSDSGRQLPRRLRALLRRGLSPRPEDRYATMDDLLSDIERVRRGWPRLGLAGAVVAAAAVATIRLTADSAPAPCEGYEDQLVDVWDDARREHVERALLATEVAHASASSASVRARIDEYADRWIELRTSVCEADRGGSEPQIACLDQRLRAVDELTKLLATADREIAERAIEATDQLPVLEVCLSAPETAFELPTEPVARAEALSIDQLTERSRALAAAARFPEAIEVAEDAAQRAEALEHGPTLVRTLLAASSANRGSSRFEVAERHATRALVQAERHGRRYLVDEVLVTLVTIVGLHRGRFAEADRIGDQVEARFVFDPPSDELRARFLHSRASVWSEAARPEQALTAALLALELNEKLYGPNSGRVAASLNTLANIQQSLGRPEAAWEVHRRSLDVRQAVYGPDHPETARALSNVGSLLLEQEKPEEAESYVRRALEIQLDAYGRLDQQVAISLNNLGSVLLRTDRAEEALAVHGDVLAIREEILEPNHAHIAYSLANAGTCLLNLERFEEALAAFERAHEIWKTSRLDRRAIPTLVGLGASLVETGRNKEGLARLGEALDIAVAADAGPRLPGIVRHELAKLLLASDPARAQEVAAQARADLSAAGLGDRVAALDAQFPRADRTREKQ